MSHTTCNYNKTHGFFNRQEIRMLAQALGLPEERIEKRLNKHGIEDTIQTSELLNLIDNGTFVTDFNHMYNSQSGRYNSDVLAKALKLLDSHLFSFNDLLNARLAFDIYEMNALRNDKNNLELILQTIKFCDYRISRLKLEQTLRHYGLDNSRVLHINEYFDLLLICNRENRENKSSEYCTRKIIDLVDPKPIDQQMMDELNTKYLRDERNWFFQESCFSKQKMIESSVWPAKLAHQYQINEASIRKAQLQRQLSASVSSLKQSRAGSACSSQSHLSSSTLRRSRPESSCSFTSLTPIITRNSICSSVQSNQSIIPEIETKKNEISDRIQQLKSASAFSAIKYAVYREDYMNELFPNGYSKPIIVSKPIERRVKKSKPSIYWSSRRVIAK